jgi:Bacteriophage HK97-gp10, putative tail-component
VTPAELPAYLEAIAQRAKDAAEPAAVGMAAAYRDRVANVTLRATSHGMFSKTPAVPGQPPAWVTGALSRSVTMTPGPSGDDTGRASVAPHTVYARIQEYGGVVHAKNRKFLMFRTDYPTSVTNFVKSAREGGGLYLNFAKSVTLPERSYMRSTTEEMVADGSLHRKAEEIFYAYVDW